jgi:hypothetical protein
MSTTASEFLIELAWPQFDLRDEAHGNLDDSYSSADVTLPTGERFRVEVRRLKHAPPGHIDASRPGPPVWVPTPAEYDEAHKPR